MRLRDRTDAGRRLAQRLVGMGLADPVVLALPRGGVPVGFEIATALGAPLEVFVARKVGAPGHAERGIGAIAEGGAQVVDRAALRMLGLSLHQFAELVADERQEVERRVHQYRSGAPLPVLEGRNTVLVDDGLATGVTAEAALQALRSHRPSRLLLAVPVCAPPTAARLEGLADDIVCLLAPSEFRAVGLWYEEFGQTSDDEVLELLGRAAAAPRAAKGAPR